MLAAYWVLASFVVSALGGVLPIFNVEVWLVGMAATCPAAFVPVVLAASLGQMAAKALLYRTGRAALPALKRRRPGVEDAIRRLAGHGARSSSLVFASAFAGVPPFYLVSLAAGVAGFPFLRFLALGLVGRLLRFMLVFLLPRLLV